LGRAKLKSKNSGRNRPLAVLLFFMRTMSKETNSEFKSAFTCSWTGEQLTENWGGRTNQSQDTETTPGGEQKNLADGALAHDTGKSEQKSSGRTDQHRSTHNKISSSKTESSGGRITDDALGVEQPGRDGVSGTCSQRSPKTKGSLGQPRERQDADRLKTKMSSAC
jgi:hypothetical protein